MTEFRLKIGINKYLIWNKGLWFGEDTSNEDLWKKGYEFYPKKVFGVKFIVAKKYDKKTRTTR